EPCLEIERAAAVLTLETDEELMATLCRVRHEQRDATGTHVGVIERRAADAGDLVAGWQRHRDLTWIALNHRDVEERDEPHVGLTDRHERLDVGQKLDVARVDHQTCVGVPGSSVASISVRPATELRRSTMPRDRCTSV